MRRIICVGNRLVAEDDAGPRVYERLAEMALPPGVEVIDGGLAGLDLLRLVEGAEQVVFVDAVHGFAGPGGVRVLEAEEVAATAGSGFDHGVGLAYLLRVLPRICAGPVPRVCLVGIEGRAGSESVEAAAALALQMVEASSGSPVAMPRRH